MSAATTGHTTQPRILSRAPAPTQAPAMAGGSRGESPDDLHGRARREARVPDGSRRASDQHGRAPVSVDDTNAGTTLGHLPRDGHACRSCEVRIAKYVGRLPNVERVGFGLCGQGRGHRRDMGPGPAGRHRTRSTPPATRSATRPGLVSDRGSAPPPASGILLVAAVAVVAQGHRHRRPRRGRWRAVQRRPHRRPPAGARRGRVDLHGAVGGLVLGLSAAFAAGRPDRAALRPSGRRRCSSSGGSWATRSSAPPWARSGPRLTMPPMLTAVLMITVAA